MKAIRSYRPQRLCWNKAEIALLRRLYPDGLSPQLERVFMRPIRKIWQAAKRYGLKKSAAFYADAKRSGRFSKLSRAGRSYQFPKGHVPANKGVRRPGYAVGRMAETQFKKGRLAHEARNYVPIGTEKIDKKRKVLMRKMTDDPSIFPVKRWTPVHVLVWQSAHGPIPPKHIVRFRPGMKAFIAAEITVDKLECVSLADNLRRNSVHNYPKELGLAIHAKAMLTRTINSRRKKREEQDQRSA